MPETAGTGISARERNVALLVAGCFFMEMLDGTIVTTSAPTIARSLGVHVASISLVITAYLVTLAALIPLSGWVSARVGGRRTFLTAIVIFTLASLGCALSATLPELVGMRIVQGVGGAMMVPVGRMVVLSRAAKTNIMRITAYLVWPGLVAAVIAPLAGGVITTYASWHWLFLINIPLGVLALSVAWRLIHPPPEPIPGKLDARGAVMTCLGLAGLAITLAMLAQHQTNWGIAALLAVATVTLLGLAVRHLRTAEHPLVDVRTMRIPTLRFAVIGFLTYSTVNQSGPFLAPLMFEEAFHWSAIRSGSLVLLIFAGNVLVKPATTSLYSRFGFRNVLIVSTLTMAFAMTALGLTRASTPIVVIGAILVLIGVVRSIGATGYTTIAFADVPSEDMRHGTTLFSIAQQLAASFGVAGGAIALRAGDVITTGTTADYTVAFMVMSCVAIGAMVQVSRLHPSAGDVLRVRRPAVG